VSEHASPETRILRGLSSPYPIDLARESDAPDLVGISVNSKTAARAYAIADAYRDRGSLVVLGGAPLEAQARLRRVPVIVKQFRPPTPPASRETP
jgi:hypothetical protein